MITERGAAARGAALDRTAEALHIIQQDARKAMGLAAKIELGRPDAPTSGDVARAVGAVARLADGALTDALAAGGKVAKFEAHAQANADRLDLSDLAAVSGDAARDLLEALDRAQRLAEVLDAQRGRTVGPKVPLGPGESRGTDYAEALSELVLRLRGEAFGMVGAGRE